MKISFDWLQEFIDIPCSPEQLGDKLTHIGLETEKIISIGSLCPDVVIGKILDIKKHPNADKLTVCQVDIGKTKLQIVCGAKNMKVHDHVPVAVVGAHLPNGLSIQKTKLRGVDSFGMMCSAQELRLSEESEGLLILPKETPAGKKLQDVLPIHDHILEINITPNRADCLSHLGIARELGVLFDQPIRLPDTKFQEVTEKNSYQVEIESPSCLRYTACVLQNIHIQPSSLHIQWRLERCGIRPLSNIIDVTNYVMLELGHPLHAFDLSHLKGKTIFVRQAKPKEKIVTLDGKSHLLNPDDLVIADQEKPIALAGVMGGKSSEVSDKTTSILLESAYFEPSAVRKMAKSLNLSSESSYRFERGIDLAKVDWASKRAAKLMQETAGGIILKGLVDKGKKSPNVKKISLRIPQIKKILGVTIPIKTITKTLTRLECQLQTQSKETFSVAIPSHRHDLKQEIDLIEEIIRFYGYDHIPLSQPKTNVVSHELTSIQEIRKKASRLLLGLGFWECLNYSFISEKEISALYPSSEAWKKKALIIQNPVSEDFKIMRPCLIPSLLKIVRYNMARDIKEIRFFELGSTYHRHSKQTIEEKNTMGLLMASDETKSHWKTNSLPIDFYDIKGVTESLLKNLGYSNLTLQHLDHSIYHPGQSAEWILKEHPVAYFGQLHPLLVSQFGIKGRLFGAEIFLDQLKQPDSKKFLPIPRFPKATRDLAIVVDQTLPEQSIREVLASFKSPLLEDFYLFDIYFGPQVPPGQKSLAYSLHYRRKDGTLTDNELNEEHQRVCRWIKDKLNCDFRI